MAEAPSLQNIEQLVAIAEQYGLEEVTVTQGGQTISVKGFASAPAPVAAAAPAGGPTVPGAVSQPAKRERQKQDVDSGPAEVPVASPMTGVFYRSPAPDAPAFVEEGDQITPGQTIGVIEAMKVFSDVPAEQAGRISRIVAANGKLLQAGDIIMYIEPDPAGAGAEV